MALENNNVKDNIASLKTITRDTPILRHLTVGGVCSIKNVFFNCIVELLSDHLTYFPYCTLIYSAFRGEITA